MPEETRYEQNAWRAWFETNKNSINIHTNVNMYREYKKLTDYLRDKPEQEQIVQYEKFLAKYPNHERTRKTLAGKLNSIAWDIATGPTNGAGNDLQKALQYAQRAVELDPNPTIVDTLAEVYLAMGNIDEAMKICKDMLDKYPGNKMFLEKLQRCKK